MTEYSYDDLKGMSVAQLRQVAEGIEDEAVQGYTQLNKQHLLEVICTALHIDMHAHHKVVGVDKKSIKARIRNLKTARDAALASKDKEQLKKIRREMHQLKRRIHKATV